MNTRSSNMLMLFAAATITTSSLLLNLSLITAGQPAGNHTTDTAALLLFYNGLTITGRKLDWKPDHDVCTWVGITCADEVGHKVSGGGKRVVEVRLPAKELYGPIVDNSIGSLHALRWLSLRHNILYGNIPSDILYIPTLEGIHLSNNSFCGDLPDFDKKAHPKNLRVVDFSHNAFGGTIPSIFGKTKELRTLNLESNLFIGNIPDFDLEKIEVLNLGNNRLEGPIPRRFQKLNKSWFDGNTGLCGTPFLTPCPASSPAYAPSSNAAHFNELGHYVALVASSLLMFLLLL